MKSEEYWFDLVPHLSSIAEQCSMGGGEPMLHQAFIKKFGERCKENNLIFNVTTNGTVLIQPDTLKDVEMLSISLDRYKYPGKDGLNRFLENARCLSKTVRTGCNFLVEDWMLRDNKFFVWVLNRIYTEGNVERIFALIPKKWPMPDILKHRDLFMALSTIYEHFYVDDCIRMIITEKSYDKWKHPCHYGTDMISINEYGQVTGCSFSDEILTTIDSPMDIKLKLPKIKIKKRHSCPYLILEVNKDGKQKIPSKSI